METYTIIREISNEEDMQAFGCSLVNILHPGQTVFLKGPLGAGKTTLVRAILQALGVKGPVRSPTYTLVESYTGCGLNLYHFDFYRFKDPVELEEAGFRELFSKDTICMVEWPENAAEFMPEADLVIEIDYFGLGRKIRVTSNRVRLDFLENI